MRWIRLRIGKRSIQLVALDVLDVLRKPIAGPQQRQHISTNGAKW